MIEPLLLPSIGAGSRAVRIAGWRFGETHSESERTDASMVPWANLTEADREKDRAVIRQMPTVVHTAGLSLEPLYSVSLPRAGFPESSADALLAEAQRQSPGM